MITGKINHYLEAVIIVDFVGKDGLLHSLEAVLDTEDGQRSGRASP